MAFSTKMKGHFHLQSMCRCFLVRIPVFEPRAGGDLHGEPHPRASDACAAGAGLLHGQPGALLRGLPTAAQGSVDGALEGF